MGDDEWELRGYGLRDHSWGPRYWQAPWYYRWLTANVDADFGFMASRVARRDDPGTRGGFVWEDGQLHLCDAVVIATDYQGDDQYHRCTIRRNTLAPTAFTCPRMRASGRIRRPHRQHRPLLVDDLDEPFRQ